MPVVIIGGALSGEGAGLKLLNFATAYIIREKLPVVEVQEFSTNSLGYTKLSAHDPLKDQNMGLLIFLQLMIPKNMNSSV